MHACMTDQNKRNTEMNKQYVIGKNNFVIIYYIIIITSFKVAR